MNRYTIRWSEYLKSGNDKLPASAQVMCFGETPIYAETEDKAIEHFWQAFPHARITAYLQSSG